MIGAGAWGTALATVLCDAGHHVTLWAHEPEVAASINASHENKTYLADVTLPNSLRCTNDLQEAIRSAELIVSVVPAQHTRRVAKD